MSLRRSSRARGAHSFGTAFGASHTSNGNTAGSGSSSRSDRSSRAPGRNGSPAKNLDSLDSSAMAEYSSEPRRARNRLKREETEEDSDMDMADAPFPHKDDDEDDDGGDDDDDDEEIVEEEETTRCICTHQDYPGLPQTEHSHPSFRQPKGRLSSGTGASRSKDQLNDEVGGLFIQCDACKVWQHGGCVGIMDEASTPDEYYCEECKPELHQVLKASNGQRYSRYKPVQDPKSITKTKKPTQKGVDKKMSREKERERDRDRTSQKGGTTSSEPTPRRRSTMNSRAAYDDDEILLRIIEESKSDIQPSPTDRDARRAKRGREEQEENPKTPSKRFRTRSQSPHSSSNSPSQSGETVDSKGKKHRPPSLRSQRQKDRERARQESLKGKSTGDSETSETPIHTEPPTKSVPETEPAAEPKPESPENLVPPPQKKNGRPTRSRGAPKQENSETPPSKEMKAQPDTDAKETEKEERADAAPPAEEPTAKIPIASIQIEPPSQPGSVKKVPQTPVGSLDPKTGVRGSNSEAVAAVSNGPSVTSSGGPSRRKGRDRSGIGELKKKAVLMLDYISRVQLELAQRSDLFKDAAGLSETSSSAKDRQKSASAEEANGASSSRKEEDDGIAVLTEEQFGSFTELGTTEMMDVLTRNLVLWQKEFGRVSERGQ